MDKVMEHAGALNGRNISVSDYFEVRVDRESPHTKPRLGPDARYLIELWDWFDGTWFRQDVTSGLVPIPTYALACQLTQEVLEDYGQQKMFDIAARELCKQTKEYFASKFDVSDTTMLWLKRPMIETHNAEDGSIWVRIYMRCVTQRAKPGMTWNKPEGVPTLVIRLRLEHGNWVSFV